MRIIEVQIDAFNRGDADALAATYAVDAVVATPLTADAPLEGREAIRDHYGAMFAAIPGLAAQIEERLTVGPLVTDHELIQPLNVRAVVTYQVENDLIKRAWLFGPVPADGGSGA